MTDVEFFWSGLFWAITTAAVFCVPLGIILHFKERRRRTLVLRTINQRDLR